VHCEEGLEKAFQPNPSRANSQTRSHSLGGLGNGMLISPELLAIDNEQLRAVQTSAEIRPEPQIPAGQALEMAYPVVPGLEILSQIPAG